MRKNTGPLHLDKYINQGKLDALDEKHLFYVLFTWRLWPPETTAFCPSMSLAQTLNEYSSAVMEDIILLLNIT